jgi:hypothetical protein
MPALTTTHVAAQRRDGRAFDEVSDAVDEGRCTFWQLDILDHARTLTLPPVYSECAEAEAVG